MKTLQQSTSRILLHFRVPEPLIQFPEVFFRSIPMGIGNFLITLRNSGQVLKIMNVDQELIKKPFSDIIHQKIAAFDELPI